MRSYQSFIFDFDGTLADTLPWLVGVMDEIAERHRLPLVPSAEYERFRRLSARQVLAEMGVPLWRMPLMAREVRRRMAEQTGHLRLFPGVPEMLGRLAARGARLAVVSSNSEGNVRAILGPENAGLMAHFDCGASLFGKAIKFRRTLRVTGSAPAETLCVGDELRDLEAAKKVALPFAAVTWGYGSEEIFRAHGADQILSQMNDLV